MATHCIHTKIKLKYDDLENFQYNNPILDQGEVAFATTKDETLQFVGDGCSYFSELKPIASTVTSIERNYINNETLQHIMTDKLPTFSEYMDEPLFTFQQDEWSEPKYKCPQCGYPVRKNLNMILTSFPAKYLYRCDNCDYTDYLTK